MVLFNSVRRRMTCYRTIIHDQGTWHFRKNTLSYLQQIACDSDMHCNVTKKCKWPLVQRFVIATNVCEEETWIAVHCDAVCKGSLHQSLNYQVEQIGLYLPITCPWLGYYNEQGFEKFAYKVKFWWCHCVFWKTTYGLWVEICQSDRNFTLIAFCWGEGVFWHVKGKGQIVCVSMYRHLDGCR